MTQVKKKFESDLTFKPSIYNSSKKCKPHSKPQLPPKTPLKPTKICDLNSGIN